MLCMNTLFEARPRWFGGPQICKTENLPAFNTRKELDMFLTKFGPRAKVHRIWLCDACHLFHATTSAPTPSGASSGTERDL